MIRPVAITPGATQFAAIEPQAIENTLIFLVCENGVMPRNICMAFLISIVGWVDRPLSL
jgi:hypothetical protein